VGGSKEKGIDLRQVRNPVSGQSAYDRQVELLGKMEAPDGQTLHEAMKAMMEGDEYKGARTAMGNGNAVHRENMPSFMLNRLFDAYEKMTRHQMEEEFAAMKGADGKPLDVGQARTDFKISGKQVKGYGTAGEAKTLKELRDLAGQGR
jgi:predicted metal-dependent phosphoesterase TrpH